MFKIILLLLFFFPYVFRLFIGSYIGLLSPTIIFDFIKIAAVPAGNLFEPRYEHLRCIRVAHVAIDNTTLWLVCIEHVKRSPGISAEKHDEFSRYLEILHACIANKNRR